MKNDRPEPALVPACALTRRRFVGASAGVALVGCGPQKMKTKPVAAPEGGIVEVEVSKIVELATPGGMVAVQPAGTRKPMIVMRLEGDAFRVLSAKCTHLGCVVRWDNDEQQLRCPCHGSRFSDSGKVTKGPAKAPLKEYATQMFGTKLQIAIGD